MALLRGSSNSNRMAKGWKRLSYAPGSRNPVASHCRDSTIGRKVMLLPHACVGLTESCRNVVYPTRSEACCWQSCTRRGTDRTSRRTGWGRHIQGPTTEHGEDRTEDRQQRSADLHGPQTTLCQKPQSLFPSIALDNQVRRGFEGTIHNPAVSSSQADATHPYIQEPPA